MAKSLSGTIRDAIHLLRELERAREQCDVPIKLKCQCGDIYELVEEDCKGRLEPFSQADVNYRWVCRGCSHMVSSGPCWGDKRESGILLVTQESKRLDVTFTSEE